MRKSIFILGIMLLFITNLAYALDCTGFGCGIDSICAAVLNTAGYNYLTADQDCSLGDGTDITASNVILDCKDHTITVENLAARDGIDVVAGLSGIVIQNCKLVNGGDCIEVNSNTQIINSTMSGCTNEVNVIAESAQRNWYIDVNVSYTNFTPADGVILQATNRTDSFEFIINGTTNANGFFRFNLTQNVTSATNTNTRTYFINASFGTFYNSTNVIVSNGNNQINLTFISVSNTAPSFFSNDTNNSAPKINEDIKIYINLSDDTKISFYKFEWNGSGSLNNNSNGTIDLKDYNITLNLSINLSYGSVIAWKFYFNDSNNVWNQTEYHYITVANTLPVINELLCYNLTKAINCTSLAYRNNLTAIRVNCTDADNQTLDISYNLTNINDSKVLIGSNSTANTSYVLFNYTYNQLINDSGLFNLTITCHDRANTTINSSAWYIDFGRLGSSLTITFNSIDYTSGNVNVRQHDWFKAILNITCSNGECGSINASLDPATAAPAVHKPTIYAYTAAYFTLLVFLLIIVFVPILIIEDKKLTKKEDLILLATIIGIVLVYLALKTLDKLL